MRGFFITMYRVSVVSVYIYRVEKYLPECAEVVLARIQTNVNEN